MRTPSPLHQVGKLGLSHGAFQCLPLSALVLAGQVVLVL
jgi:hypothetical protein